MTGTDSKRALCSDGGAVPFGRRSCPAGEQDGAPVFLPPARVPCDLVGRLCGSRNLMPIHFAVWDFSGPSPLATGLCPRWYRCWGAWVCRALCTLRQRPTTAPPQASHVAGEPFREEPRGGADNRRTALPYPQAACRFSEFRWCGAEMIFIGRYRRPGFVFCCEFATQFDGIN